MLNYEKNIPLSGENLVISFDLEWTKNYRVKNGNRPFCFSFVFFPEDMNLDMIEKQLEFGFYLCYAENEKDTDALIQEADRILGQFFEYPSTITIVGHQLSSDISIILNFPQGKQKNNFARLKNLWQTRKQTPLEKKNIVVFDSRYDLEALLKKKSRRLVDVCEECRLDVAQPELRLSMTKMQNDFYVSGNKMIMEKLSVLNIRHSLSAAVLFLMQKSGRKARKNVNVNRILRRNLTDQFEYVRGGSFKKLL
jgi:hypothetical protein